MDEPIKATWHIGAPMMPDHAEQLGRVVALWSRLEHLLNGTICQLSGIGLNLGDVFLNNVNMPARHLILEGIATRYLRDKDPQVCRALIKHSEKIRGYNRRNLLVHGLWQRGDLISAATSHPSRKDHKRTVHSWTLDEMTEIGNEISDFIMALVGLIEQIDEYFPRPPAVHAPWRRKPPARPPKGRRGR